MGNYLLAMYEVAKWLGSTCTMPSHQKKAEFRKVDKVQNG